MDLLHHVRTWMDGAFIRGILEGEPKNWTLRKVYDGEKMESLLDNPLNPIEHIKRPNELPPPSLSSQM